MNGLLFLLLISLLLVLAYCFACARRARYYWRWLLWIVLLAVCAFVAAAVGAGLGNFDSRLNSLYRRHFFAEFAAEVGESRDFTQAVRDMRQRLDGDEFPSYIEANAVSYPSIFIFITGCLCVLLAVGCEFAERLPLRYAAGAFFGLAAVMFFSGGIFRNYFALLSRVHASTSITYHRDMLDDFARWAPDTVLTPEQAAGAIDDYIAQYDPVCCGEPYGALEERLRFGDQEEE